ncbi:hypothetical protein [Burkholderia pseudomallei]|uniref:hypothetical protein n=1 Tax=Burkholderia pseudomallei TaxID=28450 RepID=UPI000536A26A|nr:hypothetical protein [Burkholderia pseudomallei]AJX19288.1 hypothetical protein BG17_4167 [Burkholderia pseudomallei MSHR491]KGW81843.1 hypothetical protein Y034_5381 [Burkholderia pseudomallei MSHR449]KGX74982.1 hypothetical protein Y033_4729 [Burkholderia pseudomallei MSHR435]
MATIEKLIKDLSGSDEKAMQTRERLELLKSAAKANLKLAEDRLSEMLRGKGGGIADLFIIPNSVQEFEHGYICSSAEKIEVGISNSVDKFFSGDYKDGFKTILKTALGTFFADTTSGEQIQDHYFVTMEYNAFIRVDVSVWKYYFAQKGISETVQQAFCYTFCKSIIDHKKVPVDTMIYIVSRQMKGDISKIQNFIDAIHKLYKDLGSQEPTSVAERALAAMKSEDR